MLTLPSVIDRTVRLYGHRTAIRDNERYFTWFEFADRVARAAGVLVGLGVKPGDRFGIISRNSFRHSELNYAGYWMGAVPVPVNNRLAPPEIRFILDDAECGILAVEDIFADLMQTDELAPWSGRMFWIAPGTTNVDGPNYEALLVDADAAPLRDCGEDDDAILLYTGGTTGRGKGVRLTHRNIVSNALQLSKAMNVTGDDIYLHTSPMFHSTDLKSTVCTMMGAGHSYLAEFSPRNVLQAIERHGITIGSLVPTMIIRTLQYEDFDNYDMSSLRLLSYGTSPIAVEWIRRIMERFEGVDLHQCYGLTETSPILSILDDNDHRQAVETGDYTRLGSAGQPLPGVDLRIVDDNGDEVPTGDAGEILIRAPSVAKGYHKRPEENAATFRDGWLHTGDVGKVDEKGYLFMLDRKKEMVITGGENVYTSEVEAVLYQHPHVHEAAVVGVPDRQYGEALFAVIVPSPGKLLTEDEVISHCRGRIGGYKIPRQMAFVDELPKSTMGKVLKNDLRRTYGGVPAKT
jgi:long-chain acyl-CoA synthetase